MPRKTANRMLKFRPVARCVDDSSGGAPPDEGLARALGLGPAVLFVLGRVVGSGRLGLLAIGAAGVLVFKADNTEDGLT